MERHICLYSHYGLDVYSVVHYIQMCLSHIQHELIYERENKEEDKDKNSVTKNFDKNPLVTNGEAHIPFFPLWA